MKNKKKFEFMFTKGYLKEEPGIAPGSGSVAIHITGFTFFHVTHVYPATWTEPEDYDGYDVEFEDTVDLGKLLAGEEFEMYGATCRIRKDNTERVRGFGDIVMKYFKRMFTPADQVLLEKLDDIFHDSDGDVCDDEDATVLFDMIPKTFWENPDFIEELGQYMYNIAYEAYCDDDNFEEELEYAYTNGIAEERGYREAEDREEAEEARLYRILDELDL